MMPMLPNPFDNASRGASLNVIAAVSVPMNTSQFGKPITHMRLTLPNRQQRFLGAGGRETLSRSPLNRKVASSRDKPIYGRRAMRSC
jgi:hypothetical protein